MPISINNDEVTEDLRVRIEYLEGMLKRLKPVEFENNLRKIKTLINWTQNKCNVITKNEIVKNIYKICNYEKRKRLPLSVDNMAPDRVVEFSTSDSSSYFDSTIEGDGKTHDRYRGYTLWARGNGKVYLLDGIYGMDVIIKHIWEII